MDKKAKMLAIFAVFGIVLVTIGVTYALFTYRANGETLSTITVGSITFQYDESQGKGHGISIANASPVASNANAKTSNDYFQFTISSTTIEKIEIPYTVTARRTSDSDVEMGNIVDMYLTEVVSGEEQATTLTSALPKFNDLSEYNSIEQERIIYNGTIPANYDGTKTFRLRMWVDNGANMSGTINTKYFCGDTDVTTEVASDSTYKCDGVGGTVSPSSRKEMSSPYNDMKFSVTVNVYARGAAEPSFGTTSVGGVTTSSAPQGAGFDQQVTIPASTAPNATINSQIDSDEDVDLNVVRTEDDFQTVHNSTGFIDNESSKIARVAIRNKSANLRDYVADGEYGDFYFRLEMKRKNTNTIISVMKLKITIEEPVATLTAKGDAVSGKTAKVFNLTKVDGQAWDYELNDVPSYFSYLIFNYSTNPVESNTEVKVYSSDDSFSQGSMADNNGLVSLNYNYDSDKTAYVRIDVVNTSDNSIRRTVKVKVTKSTTVDATGSWYE